MGYSDGQVFLAEMLGTAILVFFGNGSIANALLPGTKGHGIGFLGIAFGFGWGVFIAVQMFGQISGLFNPAVALGVAVLGEISWTHLLLCWAAQMVGGLLGGLLVYVTYLPHFQPLEIAYPDDQSVLSDDGGAGAEIAILRQEGDHNARRYASAGNKKVVKGVRLHVEPEPGAYPRFSVANWLWHKAASMSLPKQTQPPLGENGSRPASRRPSFVRHLEVIHARARSHEVNPTIAEKIAEDQEMKLVVFCTRPSIMEHYWLFCFWAEFLGTFQLTYGALMINAAAETLSEPSLRALYENGIAPFLIGMLVFVLVLASGGLTGPALNPARDLGPRIIHWVAYIPGKGPSEWWYSWVPVFAPAVGAVLGALLARETKEIMLSQLPDG